MGGRIAGQQPGHLVPRARLPQHVQQPGHGERVVEGGVGGRIAGQQPGHLVLRALLPQPVQQVDHAARVVEGNIGGGPGPGAGVTAEAGRTVGEVVSGIRVTGCGCVLVQLGGGAVQAAGVGSMPEQGLVTGGGVGSRCGPEACRGDLVLAVRAAVLIQVVGEPVHRAVGGASLAGGRLAVAVRGAGPGLAGPGRARADAGQRPADALARDGGVGQGLVQPVLAQGVPFGVGQVPGRGRLQEDLLQAGRHAQAAGVHRRADQRRRGGRRVAVPGQQLRRPRQELDHRPVRRQPGRQHQPRVPRPGQLAHLRGRERGRHGDVVAGQ